MKAASAGLITHIAGRVTSFAFCLRIERRDGAVYGFTGHDRDLVVEGLTYTAAPGLAPTALSSRADLSVDETEHDVILDDSGITEADIRAGLWDHAEVRVFLVNYESLAQGRLKQRRGWLGEAIVRDDGSARIELRGLTQALQQSVGELYLAECGADLGDSRCGVDIAAYTRTATVASVGDREVFTLMADGIEANPDAFFTSGVLIFDTGANAGVARDVLEWDAAGQNIRVFLPFPYDIEAGDTLRIQAGCDKRLATCRTTFNNRLNFRGHPHVPGTATMIDTPL